MCRNYRSVNLKYKALHGFYWMLYCIPTGYITVFLLSCGFSSPLIGTITAVSGILAAAGQLTVGKVADGCRKFTWRGLVLIIGAAQFAVLILLLVFRGSAVLNAALFPFFMILMYFQMPLINSSVFYYTARGMKIDFGSARGTGSLTYALISFAAGQLVVKFGEITVIYLSLAVLAGLTAVTIMLPSLKGLKPCGAQLKSTDKAGFKADSDTENNDAAGNAKSNNAKDSNMAENAKVPAESHAAGDSDNPAKAPRESSSGAALRASHKTGIISFAKRYPDFMLVLLGSVLVMAFHNIGHTYMIQIMEALGGNSAAMGTAFSIEALMELPVMFGFYKLISRFSADSLMVTASIAFAAKAAAYLLAPSTAMIYAAQVLQMFSNAVFASASVYYANEKMALHDKVTGQSCMTASMSIGAVLGNFSGGIILDAAGLKAMLFAAFILAAAGALITSAGVKKFKRKTCKAI